MLRIMNTCSVLGLGLSLCAPCQSEVYNPTEHEFLEWQRSIAATSETLRNKVDTVAESYDIVFVPGILGSQIKIGSFTYGRDKITADKLVYNPGQGAEASTLNEFHAQIALVFKKNVDIYGKGLDFLQGANAGKAAVEFAYDWRDDLDKTARAFDSFLKTRLPDKKIVIVAHSMGGVIAWHWKNKYNHDHKQRVIALVLLGSPLQGSCEPIRMLVEGYGPPGTSSGFEKWATHLVFGKAHAAILTFPSVFQLLPPYDPQHPCLKLRNGTLEQALNHYEPDSWLGRSGGGYQLSSTLALETGLALPEYQKRVAAAIKAGRDFRTAFDVRPFDDQVYLLYSDKHQLPSGFTAVPKASEWLKIANSWPNVDGDGRVPKESATNFGNFDAKRGAKMQLDREHGDLLRDPRFADFVSDNIAPLIAQAKRVEILAFASRDPKLRPELEAKQWILDQSLRTASMERIPELSAAAEQVAKYNLGLLRKNATDARLVGIDFEKLTPAQAAVAAGKRFSNNGDEGLAAAAYSSAIALDPKVIDAQTYRELGIMRSKQGNMSQAADYLSRAGASESVQHSLWGQENLGPSYQELGLIFEPAGSPSQAIHWYQNATKLGDLRAADSLKDIRRPPLWGQENLGSSYQDLGVIFEKAGSPSQAISSYQKAKKFGDLRAADSLKNIQHPRNTWEAVRMESITNMGK
jgi:pimeloyl-ACP methyl ester carboxylesterase